MATETVTGFITSFARSTEHLPGLELWFVPTRNGVNGDHLFVTKEVKATLTQATGEFTVGLERTDDVYGVPDGQLRYFPRITWRNGAGQPTSQDLVGWQIRVPFGGGTLEELLAAPTNGDSAYWSYAPTYEALLADFPNLSIGTWIYWATAPEDAPDNWFHVEA